MTPFPWEHAMQFGFGVLRLTPAAFWSMTPRELSAAHAALVQNGADPMGRAAMEDLMNIYPDKEHENGRC